ncbi:MAG: hypothetical protein Q9207_002916 [Kuettlingeria erythrocarpa]
MSKPGGSLKREPVAEENVGIVYPGEDGFLPVPSVIRWERPITAARLDELWSLAEETKTPQKQLEDDCNEDEVRGYARKKLLSIFWRASENGLGGVMLFGGERLLDKGVRKTTQACAGARAADADDALPSLGR